MSSDPVATVSLIALLNGIQLDRMSPVPMLKRAAIMCGRIYVDTQGMGMPGGTLEGESINALFGGNAEGIDLLADPRFMDLVLRPGDFGDTAAAQMRDALWAGESKPVFDAAMGVVDGMSDESLAPVASPTRGVDYKARGALATQLSEDLYRPEALRRWFPSAVGLITPLHTAVLTKLGHEVAAEAFPDLIELAAAGVVDYGSLAWRDVLQLRRSGFIDEFRSRMRELSNSHERSVMSALWADLCLRAQPGDGRSGSSSSAASHRLTASIRARGRTGLARNTSAPACRAACSSPAITRADETNIGRLAVLSLARSSRATQSCAGMKHVHSAGQRH